MNSDGSNVRQLTENPGDDMHPVWSPDGTKIFFNSNRDGNYEIYVMNPDGSNLQRLTDSPKADMFPRLSPDGAKITYALVDFQTFEADVHVMNVDGTDDTTLTSDGRINEDPLWSPDGSKIVFQSDRDGNFEIYVMNSDGSDQQRLTQHPAGDYWPAWGPDIAPLTSVNVPHGSPVFLDGTISPGEWDDAVVESFADGSELLLMYADDYLYLGIRAKSPEMIAGNVFIQRGDEISIMHSSAALGTAIFQRGNDIWQQTQDFIWQCRSTSQSDTAQAERDAFLQQEGWVALNSYMGTPNELEYQIEISEQTIHMAVVYIKASPPYEKIPWPAGLDDDSILPTQGGLPPEMQFSPNLWGIIAMEWR